MVTGGEDKKVNMWAIGKPNVILVRLFLCMFFFHIRKGKKKFCTRAWIHLFFAFVTVQYFDEIRKWYHRCSCFFGYNFFYNSVETIVFHLSAIFIVHYLWFCSLALCQVVWEFIDIGLISKWKIFSFKKNKEYCATLKKRFQNIIMSFVRKPFFVWYLLKVTIKPPEQGAWKFFYLWQKLWKVIFSLRSTSVSRYIDVVWNLIMTYSHLVLVFIYVHKYVSKYGVAVTCYYLLWKKPFNVFRVSLVTQQQWNVYSSMAVKNWFVQAHSLVLWKSGIWRLQKVSFVNAFWFSEIGSV